MEANPFQVNFTRACLDQGFSLVRFAAPPLGQAGERFQEWLEQGYAAEMGYLARRREERLQPQRLLPELKSIVVLGHPYDSAEAPSQVPGEGQISKYAWGEDYHSVLREKLNHLEGWLRAQRPQTLCYASVDAQAVLEKAWATKAGVGWLGKHTNVIHPEQGSYFFLSCLLTNLDFVPDDTEVDRCGTCRECIDVCPTGAIVAPYVLDASRCISYLTIELKGPIPRHLRPLMGNHIFGCDDCQEVCPWNRFSQKTLEKRFWPRGDFINRPLVDYLKWSPEFFKQEFKDSPISRPKWRGLMRNVLVAIGNSGHQEWASDVELYLDSHEALLRGHAVWAYGRLLGRGAVPKLAARLKQEADPWVREELHLALGAGERGDPTPL